MEDNHAELIRLIDNLTEFSKKLSDNVYTIHKYLYLIEIAQKIDKTDLSYYSKDILKEFLEKTKDKVVEDSIENIITIIAESQIEINNFNLLK